MASSQDGGTISRKCASLTQHERAETCTRWVFGASSTSAIIGNLVVQMYALYHPDFEVQPWHVFIAYLLATWLCSLVVLFANRILPAINNLGLFFIVAGVFITIVVCAAMPGRDGRPPHATNDFVWKDWSANTGYSSQGFVFLMGMLNGAFAIGVPDCVSHLAEEIPQPEKNVPRAIAAQMTVGFVTALGYMMTIFYAINDLHAVLSGTGNFPIAQIYLQATGSPAGAVGLLVLVLLPSVLCLLGVELTASRTLWTLARDGATPFPSVLGSVSTRWRNPFWAQVATTCLVTILGCLYVGSTTAFNAFVGSFVIFLNASYVAAILPNLLTRRKYVKPGPFYMGNVLAYTLMGISCAYILVFIIIYCFPFSLPVSAGNMNYSSLIFGGLTIFMMIWWLVGARKGYRGPALVAQEAGITYFEESVDKIDRN